MLKKHHYLFFIIIAIVTGSLLVSQSIWRRSEEEKGTAEDLSKDSIIDLENRLIFLPGPELTYKYFRQCDTENWPVFINKANTFSFKHLPGSDIQVKKLELQPEFYYSSLQKKALKPVKRYSVEIDRPSEEKFEGPYSFFFDIGVYQIIGNSPLSIEEYVKPFLLSREEFFMSPEEIKEWSFIICKPFIFEEQRGKVCNLSNMGEGDFYILDKDKFYVVDHFMTKDFTAPPEWIDDEPIVARTKSLQQKLMFQTIVSTFRIGE